ncbi:MAG: ComEC/Rec2 family competence protein, partial [Gemmatimonadaceae bacterium]|nr:ComEC/Rec2 family competence protein [Gemmatimonadaceae bacterium]
MPPVVAAVAVTLIGLAAGAAGDAWVLAGAAAFATGAVARVRQPWLAVALAALAIGAALRGSAHRWREAACATALQDAARVDSVTVVVDVDAPAGSYVPGRARLPWCSMAVGVQARVATTGGVVLRIDAPFRAGARRPVAELRRVRPVAGAHDPLRAWRAAAARRIDARFGGDAPLVRALVVADMHDIDDATRTRWARAGLVHALSVSGLHVGIVAGVLALLAQALGARPARAAALSTTGLVAYVAVIGAPA